MTELYKKYRPKLLKGIIGQPKAVKQIREWIDHEKIPHAILLTGPSGTGKTTAARIIAKKLGCVPHDIHEMNAADCRGIDEIRAIDRSSRYTALSGGNQIWIVDEAHQLTKQAQDSFLKPLEDTPEKVYFILCSSEPNKLKKAVRTRCSKVRFNLVSDDDMTSLLKEVCDLEKIKVTPKVLDSIVENAAGHVREALVLLDQVIGLSSESEMLAIVSNAEVKQEAIELCRALMNPKMKWTDIAKIIENLKDEEPESIRRLVLSYANTTLLKSGRPVANVIIDYFRDHWFDCGMAGLTSSCFSVLGGRK